MLHMGILPYIDLTLMACNASTAIVANMILSTKYLDEVFSWKYDFTALVLIVIGSSMIVLSAHTEKVELTKE